MRTTVTLEEGLFNEALAVSGNPSMNAAELVREAVKTFIRVNAAKRLAALGGTAPNMKDIPRRRPVVAAAEK